MLNKDVIIQHPDYPIEYRILLDGLFSQLRVNDLYHCIMSHCWYIIKNIKNINNIECLLISNNVICVQILNIENFAYAKKETQLPRKLIDKYESYGININYDN